MVIAPCSAIICRVTAKARSILLLIILWLAFAVRVYRLDAQSIWYDEGLSIQLASLPPDQTIALSATTDHPPLHALLLGGWLRLAGDSDFAVRFLSLFCGVLAVALTYAWVHQMDERAGLIAAFLMTLAPFAVYYSQETRGYTLLTALVLVAAIAFVKLLRGDQRRRIWIIYSGAMVAALYTHYFAAFAWAAINVAWLLNLRGLRKPRRFWTWIVAQIIILACFAPWLPNVIAQVGSNATYFPGRVTWDTVFGDTWRAFSVGEWGDGSIIGGVWLVLIGLGLIAALTSGFHHGGREDKERNLRKPRDLPIPAAVRQWAARRRAFVVTIAAILLVPLLLMSALAWLKPKFAPRYLLPSLPAFIAVGSIGLTLLIDGLRTRWCLIASIGLIAGLAVPTLADAGSLLRLYTDASIARPDGRSVAAYIAAHEVPGDAIILLGGHQAPAFNHYYRGSAAVFPLPPDLLPAVQSPLDAQAIQQLADITRDHPRIWLVLWQNEISDPTNVLVDALSAQGQRIEVGQNFHAMSLLLFDVRAAVFVTQPQHLVDFAFVQMVRLTGYNVDKTHLVPGDSLTFSVYLMAEGSIAGDYQIFAHLIGPDGSLVAQADHIAGADSYPTSLWRPGNLILNRFQMTVPLNAAPGEYRIRVGLYDSAGRLKLIDGRDQIDLIQLTVTR